MPEPYSGTFILDVDETDHGFEVVLRFSPEDKIAAWIAPSEGEVANLPIAEELRAVLATELGDRDR